VAKSDLEEAFAKVFAIQCKASPQPDRQHKFHPERRWRFDFAWPRYLVAVEIDGGIFMRGRHSRGASFTKDCEKMNAATLLNWKVLRYTTKDLEARPVQCAEEVAELLSLVPTVEELKSA
jgi:very-short-patch-repair endonuclease